MISQIKYQSSFPIDYPLNESSQAINTNSKSPQYSMSIASSSTPMDISMVDTPSDRKTSSAAAAAASASASGSKKNVPLEFTSYGTTPSGKPRLFVCQVCTRAFARLEHLRRHERSHTKEKPFSCGVCQRKFSRRDLLLRHAQKLHAGCSDAITRLRRKSIKRSGSTSNNSNNNDLDDDDDDLDTMDDDENDRRSPSRRKAGSKNHNDPVEFNLNLFENNSANTINSKVSKNIAMPRTRSPSISRKDSNATNSAALQRQLFEQRKKNMPTRTRRGASFSAQSGANYSIGIPEFSDIYPNTENVEFSTPQLLPSSAHQDMNNIPHLSSIPDMSIGGGLMEGNHNYSGISNMMMRGPSVNEMRQDSISSMDTPIPGPPSISHHGSFSIHNNNGESHLISDNVNDFNFNGLSYTMPTATISNQEIQHGVSARKDSRNGNPRLNTGNNPKHEETDFGYSFYDVPESILSLNPLESIASEMHKQQGRQYFKSLTPIKQEMEDEMVENQIKNPEQLNENYDLNFLKDIDELTNEYDVNSKFLPNGYSFYGDNPSAPSSGIETNSPSGTSPSVSYHNPKSNNLFVDSTLNHNQLLDIEISVDSELLPRQQPPQPQQHQQANQFPLKTFQNDLHNQALSSQKQRLNKYSKNKLFTNNMRQMINKSLSKYPISGIMTPTIPSNEKLEFYLTTFAQIFLTHFPFIHTSKLTEYEIMNMTSNEDICNESARVCLPLLIATIGALLASNKNDSEHLYEASRRTIHIYLESRKKSVGPSSDGTKDGETNNSTVNPLWLIQSLTLSVIYGLFSDNENNVYIVIRQLNALNSLVKTSIKRNRPILFSINGEDEECYHKMNQQTDGDSGSLFSTNHNDELKFKNNLNIQSQVRIVFMIYRLTNFLLMMYNVPLTLSVHDLNNLQTPNKNDELLWSFKSFQEFQEYNNNQNSGKSSWVSLNDYFTGDKIIFKDVLLEITKAGGNFDEYAIKNLGQMSTFGFISLVHGLFEIEQYQKFKNVDIFMILDKLTKYVPSNEKMHQPHQTHHSLHHQQMHPSPNFEKVDYALLVNFFKISTLIDFKLVKEQSWLRNFEELSKNFNKLLMDNNGDQISDYDYLRIVDSCLMIIKLILFKSEECSGATKQHNGDIGGFSTDFGFLNSSGNYGNGEEFSENFQGMNSLLAEQRGQETVDADNTLSGFEKSINLRIFEEFDNSTHSIHSQMLFYVFAVLSVFSIYILKKNNANASANVKSESSDLLFELNHRFSMVLKLLDKIEMFLKIKYQSGGGGEIGSGGKLDQYFTNLYLNNNLDTNANAADNGDDSGNSLEKTMYILRIGEVVLSYLFDSNIKVSIFKKLGGSLACIRKFLGENEARILS